MKKLLLVFFVAAFAVGCSKDENVEMIEDKTQNVEFVFVKDRTLSSKEVIEEPYEMSFLFVWKSDGKDFVYKGLNDGTYAFDNISEKSFESDREYINVRSKTIGLLPGKYFVAIIPGVKFYPSSAYSYKTFTVEKGKDLVLKKNVSTMTKYSYNVW